MIPHPNVMTWALAATAAGALALPGAWVLLVLIPAAVAVAAAWAPHRPRHAAPAAVVIAEARRTIIAQTWLYGPGTAAGSMDLTAELAWRRRYDIPPGLPARGMVSGSGPPRDQLHPRPYLVPFEPRPPGWQREQLERLASTGEHHGLARQLEYRADLEAQDADRATYLAALAARAAQIRQAALEGWQ